MTEAAEPTELTNKSVTKAVRLLRELAAQPRSGATVTTLAKAVGISRPTAFRLLYSLERTGLVDRIDNNYILGWEMARLGRLADPYAGLVTRAQPLLQELADKFNESVSMSVPNAHDGVDLVAEAFGSHYVGAGSQMSQHLIGHRWPEKLEAYTEHTITDRTTLLRELQQIREQGFGVIDNELEEGLLSLSRPVRDSAGNMVAILTLNGPRYRFGRDRIPEALQSMQDIVDRLSEVFWHDAD